MHAELEPAELDSALDPTTYVGSAEVFVDRPLALYRQDLCDQEDE